MRKLPAPLIILAVGLFLSGARAESPPGPNPSPPAVQGPEKKSCAPNVGADPPTIGSGQSDRNLNDQLAESGGIICPPADTDPGMTVPPKDTGRMPVIPPPGTLGGDQNVRPK